MLHLCKNNLIEQELSILRNKNSDGITFRKSLVRMGRYVGYEIANTMDVKDIEIETPLARCRGVEIVDMDKVVIINILRAAIPMVEGMIKVFPRARVGIISAFRDEEEPNTLEFNIDTTYVKVPKINKEDVEIIVDPMLATSSTLSRVIQVLSKFGEPKRLIVACTIASRYGIEKILELEEFLGKRGSVCCYVGNCNA